jgi:acyl carrier protein
MTTDSTSEQVITADHTGAVVAVLAQMLSRDADSITPKTRFFEDLAFDSTNVLELLMQLETELGVEFDAETLEPADFETVGSLVAYVDEHAQPDN